MKNLLRLKLAVALMLISVTGHYASAQGYDYEAHEHTISVGAGLGYMFSDAAATFKSTGLFKDFVQQDMGILLTAEYRKYLTAGVAYVLNGGISRYQGTRDYTRHLRDYQYTSYLGELSALGNFEFFSFFSQRKIPIDVYAIGGVGLITAAISHQSFSQESGRPNKDDRLSKSGGGFNLIAGFGLRFPISDILDLRIEGKYNTGTSDYLDGYSPSNSKHPDAIVEGVVKVSYHLWIKECHCR